MFERYTKAARMSIVYGREEAAAAGSGAIEVRHLLLGIVRADPELSARILAGTGLDSLRERLAALPPEPPSNTELGFSPRMKVVVETAAKVAGELHSYEITTGHLLEAVKRTSPAVAAALAT